MTQPSSETGDGIVQVAYLHPEHVSHSWHDSMRRSHDYDRTLSELRIAPKPLNIRCSSGRLVPSRNFATQLFLDRTEHEWLLMVDTDMGWQDDAIHRLLEAADPVARPVVGGLCFALMESQYDGAGGHRFRIVPTMYNIGTTVETGRPSFCYYGDYDYLDDTVVQVAGTGAAFLLIHRGALEKLRAEHGDHWWDQVYDSVGTMVGEDIAFCARLGQSGIPLHVHTGVKITHHKQIWLSEEDYLVQQAVTVRIPDVPVHVDVQESLASLAANEHVQSGMLKLPADLDRYAQIIEATKPEVIVETGTRTGASALWFARRGLDVVTVDVIEMALDLDDRDPPPTTRGRVTQIVGDSADPTIAAKVAGLVAGRRCMVSLDSDHSAEHVTREIELYGPLVSPGCYLVVEDGIFGYAPPALRAKHGLGGMVGSPLDAIAEHLVDDPAWSRDVAIERVHPASHHPAGFWLRNADG